MRATDEQLTRRIRRGHGLPYVAALDGIRAVAVAGVVLYHAGARWLPGGFLGVDLFFVLSGFLITSLLLAEREATGRIDLPAFWARRARRLLPAAFLVIALSVLAVAIASPSDLPSTRADAIASFLYVNNWHQILADQSYFQAFARPSLLRHLWSLAVEEQFYLLWPLVMGICVAALGRRRTTILTLVLAVASSGLMAVLFTPGRDPSRVYYGTDTHATGLLIGALPGVRLAPVARGGPQDARDGARRRRDRGPRPARRGDADVERLRAGRLPGRPRGGRRHHRRARRGGHPRRDAAGRGARRAAPAVDRRAQLRDLPLALAGDGHDAARHRPRRGRRRSSRPRRSR